MCDNHRSCSLTRFMGNVASFDDCQNRMDVRYHRFPAHFHLGDSCGYCLSICLWALLEDGRDRFCIGLRLYRKPEKAIDSKIELAQNR